MRDCVHGSCSHGRRSGASSVLKHNHGRYRGGGAPFSLHFFPLCDLLGDLVWLSRMIASSAQNIVERVPPDAYGAHVSSVSSWSCPRGNDHHISADRGRSGVDHRLRTEFRIDPGVPMARRNIINALASFQIWVVLRLATIYTSREVKKLAKLHGFDASNSGKPFRRLRKALDDSIVGSVARIERACQYYPEDNR